MAWIVDEGSGRTWQAEWDGRVVAVLVAHQRQTSAACLCGWSVLGASHAEHVADMLYNACHDAEH